MTSNGCLGGKIDLHTVILATNRLDTIIYTVINLICFCLGFAI